MFGDDDDAEESAAGATRYPVMPSLVALQQMRNRLHMGHLGRKLMKWTSIATGGELRKLSADLQGLYKTFTEDMKQAFILLARSRYFFPDLNKMVVEDVQLRASIMVTTKTKTVAGVRILKYKILETNTSYDYLGLGQGGETIEEAKQFWINLLKLQIRMVELRTNFVLIETVHKTATKRLNVINKIVIPKTKVTMKYIILELEETAREELHRIKKVQAWKRKKNKKAEPQKAPTTVCPICNQLIPGGEIHEVDEETPTGKSCINMQKEPTPLAAPKLIEEIPVPLPIPPLPSQPMQSVQSPQMTQSSYIKKPSELIAVHEPLLESGKNLYKPICCTDVPYKDRSIETPPFHLTLGDIDPDSKLENLRKMINETITLGKDVAKTDTDALNINEFLKLCEDAKLTLDLVAGKENISRTDSKLAIDLEHLKCHIREVIDVTRELRDITFLSPSIENFIQNCEDVDKKIKIAIKNIETATVEEPAKSHLLKLKDEIDHILNVIDRYKEEGLLTESVEEFLNVCNQTKSKLDCYTKDSSLSPDGEKLDNLKSHVDKLETITTEIKRDGIRSTSIEHFLSSCKDFKIKLEKYKAQNSESKVNEQVIKLVEQINDAVKSTQDAKKDGLITESVESFIKSCETFKSRLESKSKDVSKSQHKHETKFEGVMELINNLQEQGLISASLADFLRASEDTKNYENVDQRYGLASEGNLILSPTCGELCTCQSDESQDLCDHCQETDHKVQEIDSLPTPCNTCGGAIPVDDLKHEGVTKNIEGRAVYTPCKSCLKLDLEETDCNECMACSEIPKEQPEEKTGNDEETENIEIAGNLGLFEKKVRTITKIKRFRTEKGDIREEKEVTTIKKVKHDPNETDIDHEDLSCDSFEVGMCITPNQNQIGFRNLAKKSKSEQVLRVSSLNSPRFKQSVSFNPQVLFVRNPSQVLFLADTEETSSTTSFCIYPNFFL